MNKRVIKNITLSILPLILLLTSIGTLTIYTYTLNKEDRKIENALEYETCELLKVVDGDTLFVEINGKKEYVRLLNVDTPESVNPNENLNTEEGKFASNFVKELLKNTKTLYLTKDVSDRDKYGRLLRLVWLKIPISDSKEEIKNYTLNGILVKNKIARVVVYDDYRYYRELSEIENGNH